MKHKFDKRIFTAGILVKDLGFLLYSLLQIIGVLQNEKINKALIEKIMLVVSQKYT